MSKEYPCVHYDNEKCKKFSEPGVKSYCVLGPCEHETPSNADRIRAMTDEELAEWLCNRIDCTFCKSEMQNMDVDLMCTNQVNGVLDWLQQPCGGAERE